MRALLPLQSLSVNKWEGRLLTQDFKKSMLYSESFTILNESNLITLKSHGKGEFLLFISFGHHHISIRVCERIQSTKM